MLLRDTACWSLLLCNVGSTILQNSFFLRLTGALTYSTGQLHIHSTAPCCAGALSAHAEDSLTASSKSNVTEHHHREAQPSATAAAAIRPSESSAAPAPPNARDDGHIGHLDAGRHPPRLQPAVEAGRGPGGTATGSPGPGTPQRRQEHGGSVKGASDSEPESSADEVRWHCICTAQCRRLSRVAFFWLTAVALCTYRRLVRHGTVCIHFDIFAVLALVNAVTLLYSNAQDLKSSSVKTGRR